MIAASGRLQLLGKRSGFCFQSASRLNIELLRKFGDGLFTVDGDKGQTLEMNEGREGLRSGPPSF